MLKSPCVITCGVFFLKKSTYWTIILLKEEHKEHAAIVKNLFVRSIAWKILYYLNVSPCCCKQTCLCSLSDVLSGTKVQYVT